MRTVPFFLLLQGPRVFDETERLRRVIERNLGVASRFFQIPEYHILVATEEDRSTGEGEPSPSADRPWTGDGPADLDDPRLLFAIEHRPRPSSSRLPVGTDLPCARPSLIARLVPGRAWTAGRTESGRVSELLSLSDVFALYDPARDVWVIGRSHPGLRTLYYRVPSGDDVRFAASTQLRALLPTLQRQPNVDHPAVSRYLCNGFFSDPETPFEELRSLLSGEVLRAPGPGTTWTPVHAHGHAEGSGAPYPRLGERDADGLPTERVRSRLIEAVATRTAEGDETACLLSGGVDSSTVAAVATTLLGKRVHTFSLVFEDEGLSEAKYATAVARRIGSKHENVLLRQPDFEASLDWLLGALDLPTTDALNSLLICRAVADAGHPVALAGVGSDELFGGHDCMRKVPKAMTLLRNYRRLPRFARAGSRRIAARLVGCRKEHWLPSYGLRGKFMSLLDQEPDPLAVYLLGRRVLLPEAVAALKPAVPRSSYDSLPPRALEAIPGTIRTQTLLKQLSYFEQEIYLRNQLLRDLGMVGVACSLDIRLPFLDRALIAEVWSLAPGQVFRGGRPKKLLIDSVSDVLPVEAYERPKLGFVLPIGQWLGGMISARLHELTAQPELLETLGLDRDTVRTIVDDCATAGDRIFYTREWCIFVLLDWYQRHSRDWNSG